MSRAFVKEHSDWYFCIEKHEECMFANERGTCLLKKCRMYPEEKKEESSAAKNGRKSAE